MTTRTRGRILWVLKLLPALVTVVVLGADVGGEWALTLVLGVAFALVPVISSPEEVQQRVTGKGSRDLSRTGGIVLFLVAFMGALFAPIIIRHLEGLQGEPLSRLGHVGIYGVVFALGICAARAVQPAGAVDGASHRG